MKFRKGFVSNSSSSSFIVIDDNYDSKELQLFSDYLYEVYKTNNMECKLPCFNGKYEFGWEIEKSSDFLSKLNFCAIQCYYMVDGNEMRELLTEVLKEDLKLDFDILFEKEDYSDGYIDHQSSAIAGENIEMFYSTDSLRNFLYSSNSYIQTDNDNH